MTAAERVAGRMFLPLLLVDVDGRRVEARIPDAACPPTMSRPVTVYVCSDCAEVTIDPEAHSEMVHDGPACRLCGCTDDNACLTVDGPCYWLPEGAVGQPLCSACGIDDAELRDDDVDLDGVNQDA